MDGGVQVTTLGEIWNAQGSMEKRILELETSIAAQGGVNFAGNSFVSKKQLLELIVLELGPNPAHFAGWPCPISICAHNQSTRFRASKDEVLK